MTKGTKFSMFKKGQKVLVRMMECVNLHLDEWIVVYKPAVVSSDPKHYSVNKKMYNVRFDTGTTDFVWDYQIVERPEK